MKITIEKTQQAKFKIDLLKDGEKVGEVKIKYDRSYPKGFGLYFVNYKENKGHFIDLILGPEIFQKSFTIDTDGDHLIFNDSPIEKIKIDRIEVEENELVKKNAEDEDFSCYLVALKSDSSVKKIDIIKKIMELCDATLYQANRIIRGERSVELTKTQAQYFQEEIKEFASLETQQTPIA